MDEAGVFGEKVIQFFDPLHDAINRAVLGVEVRITLDKLLGKTEAKLIDQEGTVYGISHATLGRYNELKSLVYEYISKYGKNQEIEKIRQRWKPLDN